MRPVAKTTARSGTAYVCVGGYNPTRFRMTEMIFENIFCFVVLDSALFEYFG